MLFTPPPSLLLPLLLLLGVGFFWSLAYVLIIRQGFQDRTYGMPLAALCANISWEAIFSFVFPPAVLLQQAIYILWFSLDLVILYQFLRFGPREYPDLPRRTFYAVFGAALVTAFSLVLFISWEFHDLEGNYAAYGQNLLMSVLFIAMLYRRKSLRGQSLGIAVSKMLGTALASLGLFLYADRFRGSALMGFLYVSVFAYDLVYVVKVWAFARERATGIASSGTPVEPEHGVLLPR